jgi:hypothetical protein
VRDLAGIEPQHRRARRAAAVESQQMAKKVTQAPRQPPRSAKVSRHAKSTSDGVKDSDVRILARDAALAALRRLADLSRSEDERVALAATQELLNRAFGKAAAGAGEEPTINRPLVIKIVRFGDIEGASEA